MTLKEEEFGFRDFLDQINVMINGQCLDKGLHYECNIIGYTEDYYIGDAMKLKQVLINILGNAVKFTNSPGTVTFNVEQIKRFDQHCMFRFIMQDTGVGMSKEYIPKIFEAFSQENEGSSNKYGSTGLGMAITRNIVSLMNGEIEVESEKGVGTTFTVTVTLKVSDRSIHKDHGELIPSEMRLLVVEDMELNAENGQIALEMFSDHPMGYYDAILMDVRMPVRNGLDATRAIRELERADAGEIPIIAMTANAFDEDVQISLQAGMDAHLSKPVEPELLYETLDRLIQHK